MALLAEGIWPCTVFSAAFGEDDKGSPQVQINVRIDEGPSAGRVCTYEDQVNARSALYISRSCKAVGWRGDLTKLKEDAAAWIEKTGGKSTVEIKHIEIKTGKRAGQIWDKPNSIGRGPRVLNAPTQERLSDANEAMRRAMADDGGAPPDDVPHAGDRDDIPFITCGIREPSAIAKVLR
jgi:hypothetical protein